ncbi:MAG: hypothetical protein R2862_08180 [Thermoanaerobaculia bacterium]
MTTASRRRASPARDPGPRPLRPGALVAVWESDETLPRGETIRATLFADCAVNRRGPASRATRSSPSAPP